MPGLVPGILFAGHEKDRRDKPGDDENRMMTTASHIHTAIQPSATAAPQRKKPASAGWSFKSVFREYALF